MIIRHGTLSLQTISIDDLELIRNWRNDSSVNQYLLTRNVISFQQQLEWFSSLNNGTSIYFILKNEDNSIGLVYAHKIDCINRSFEGSIFIGDEQYLSSHYPVKAVLMLSFFLFEKLQFKTAYSIVNRKNKNAIDLDSRLGYRTIDGDMNFVRNLCHADDFLKFTESFRKVLFKGINPEIIYQDGDERFTFIE